MRVDQFVEDIRQKINVKNDLIEQKKELLGRINNGRVFFTQAITNPVSAEKMAEATKLISDISSELAELEAKILDTDIIIITALEAYLSDSVIKCTASQKLNDAGDNIDAKQFVFVPYKQEGSNYVEITPDELWFLKIIKQAIGIRNTEIIAKDEYYNKE
jgi:hypothetical protein